MSKNKGRKEGAGAGPRKQQPAQRQKGKANMVTAAVAVTSRGKPRAPMTRMVNGGTVVSHTETYGVNITGTSAFGVSTTWAIQPGLQTYSKGSPLGTWLGQIASNFDNYEIQRLKFKFRSACSTLTTGLGVFAYEPNPEGTAPTSYQEMRNMYSVDGSVHANLEFDISSKLGKRLLIRKGNVINLPSYDSGKVYFATIGVNNDTLVGFIDVEYRIKLINPQSSITTSSIPPTYSLSPFPSQLIELDYSVPGMTDVNVVNDGDYPCALMQQYGTSYGAPLFAQVGAGSINAHTDDFSGCKFSPQAKSGNARFFRASTAGRYRIKLNLKLGYEDLKMFCVGLFRSPSGSAVETLCTRRVYSTMDAGATVDLPSDIFNHRGFTGTAINDPNPGTEVWPAWTWDVDLAAGDAFRFLIGYLTYNSVSTTTANVRAYAGLGKSTMFIEYLGPSAT